MTREYHFHWCIHPNLFTGLSTTVNGSKSVDFVMDTAASSSVISRRLAEELQLNETDQLNLPGADVMPPSGLTMAESFSIEHYTQKNPGIVIVEFFDSLNQIPGCEHEGILGVDFLSAYQPAINYPQNRLLL